jgi:hypothetical protein
MKTPLSMEIYYAGAWHDITATDDVLARDPVTISGGLTDSRALIRARQQLKPTQLVASIENLDGQYSPRNPMSPLYGLIGRNTPLRTYVTGYDVTADSFNRESAAGWGNSEYGALPWIISGAGGSVLLSDAQVHSRVALHSIPTTAAFRLSYLDDDSYNLADLTLTAYLQALDGTSGDILGNDIEGGLMLRIVDNGHYYHPRVEFKADQSIAVSLHAVGGTGNLGSATVPGLTYTGQWLRVKAQCKGRSIRMKVWDASLPPPPEGVWHLEVLNNEYPAAGGFGVRSGVAAGNTNVSRTVYYANLTVDRAYRFHGEVESWPPRWEANNKDAWVPITAWGIMRRFNAPGKDAAPVLSALRRRIQYDNPIAYWPLEDPEGSVAASSGLSGGIAMTQFGTGTPCQFGITEDHPFGTIPLPDNLMGLPSDPHQGLRGEIPPQASTVYQVEWICRRTFDAGAGAVGPRVMQWISDNPTFRNWYWEWNGVVTGQMDLYVTNQFGVETASITGVALSLDTWHHVVVKAKQNGGSVDITIYRDGASVGTASVAGILTGPPYEIKIGPENTAHFGAVSVGHVAVYATEPWQLELYHHELMTGWPGETAAGRFSRLCDEARISYVILGDRALSEIMGPQRPAPFMDLIYDAVDVENGWLFEPRSFLGLGFRCIRSVYNEAPTVSLSYAAGGEVSPPLRPAEDTSATVNDVTVSREGGVASNAVRGTGPLNVAEPSAGTGGVGRYPKWWVRRVNTDAQTIDQAWWALHLGTWDEARYPDVTVSPSAMAHAGKAHLIGPVLSVDIADRITINDGPPDTFDSIELLSGGLVETLGSHVWRLEFGTTPYLPYEAYVVGTGSGNRSRVDTTENTSTVLGSVTATATAFDVLSTVRPWIDTAGYAAQFPYDIGMRGERIRVTGAVPMAADTFARTESNGWGTGESGGVWSAQGGAASEYAVSGGTGRHNVNAVNSGRITYQALNLVNSRTTLDVRAPAIATGAEIRMGRVMRYTDVNNFYRVEVSFQTNSTVDLAVWRRASGVDTTLLRLKGLGSYVPGDWWRLVVDIVGSTIRASAHKTSVPAPGWLVTVEDTSLIAAGAVGCRTDLATGNTNTLPLTCEYDNNATLTPQTFTVQRSVNGVVKSHPAGTALSLWRAPVIAL